MDSIKTTPFRLGDRVIHPDLGQIESDEKVAEIEPKAMAVLLCLVEHDGAVVSADTLIERIWQGRPMGDNPVYNCITKLRKAFGDVASKPRVIATVPKKGYRLLQSPELLQAEPAEEAPAPRAAPPGPGAATASIAVLPFACLSPDTEHRFLGEGIASELHSSLSRVHRLRIASRRAAFSPALQDLDLAQVGQQLNVHYVLSGTLRCARDRLRLIVELDDVEDGVQLWSKAFDAHIDDVLALEQDIASAIVSEFGGQRLRAEIARAARQQDVNLDAWSLVQKARSYVLDYSSGALDGAGPLLERAVQIDPQYGAAHSALAAFLAERIVNGLSPDMESDEQRARDAVAQAMQLAPNDPFVLKMCGSAWAYFGEADRSADALRRAVDIAPFDFGAWGHLGWPLTATGRREDLAEVHEILERILACAPNHPGVPYWRYHQSVAHTGGQDHDAAVEAARESVRLNPGFSIAWMQYGNALGALDDMEAALRAVEEAARVNPAMTARHYERVVGKMCLSPEVATGRLAGLHAAGAFKARGD